MPSLLPVLVKHSLGNATALTRYSSQHLRNGRCEAPTYLAEVAANRLSFQRVRQFEKLVRTHVKPFDRLSYPASEAESQ